MDLATQQRKLLGLIKSTYSASNEDDPYIRKVAGSSHLDLVREIAIWWRAFGLEQYCALTARLLKRRGVFDDVVTVFASKPGVSPFIEKLGEQFLEDMSSHDDQLVASLAQFELAVIKVKLGDSKRYTVQWAYNPYAVLDYVLKEVPFSQEKASGSYQTIVSHDLSGLFLVTRQDELK